MTPRHPALINHFPWKALLFCGLLSVGIILSARLPGQAAPTPEATAQNPGATTVANAGEVQALPAFNVNDTEDKGYKASNAISGTGFNEKIQDLPFSLTAITTDYITDVGATDLMDVVSGAAGIKAASHEYTNGEDAFLIRGFVQYPEHDGIYEGANGNTSVDPCDIERVEVAKGPSSLLYGVVSPGGTINYITKQASDTPFGVLTVKGGSLDYLRASIDINQPLISGVLDFRLNAMWENGFQAEVIGNQKTLEIVPTVTWNITKNLSFRVNYMDFDRHEDPPQTQPPFFYIGTPASIANVFNKSLGYPTPANAWSGAIGTNLSPYGSVDVTNGYNDGTTLYLPALGQIPRNFNLYADNDWIETTFHVFQAELDFKNIANHWNARVNYDYNKSSTGAYYTTGNTIGIAPTNSLVYTNGAWSVAPAYAALTTAQQNQYIANFGTSLVQNPGSEYSALQNGVAPPLVISRLQRYALSTGINWTVQAEAVGSYTTPIGTFRPLVGVYNNKDFDYLFQWNDSGNAALPNVQPWDINPASPTYYLNNGPAPTVAKIQAQDVLSYDFSKAAYLVLNCSLFDDKLQIVGGARFNSSGEASTNFLGTTASAVYGQGLVSDLMTYQLGVGYKVRPDVLLYASYSESYTLPGNTFLSEVGYNAAGLPIPLVSGSAKPSVGEGTEFGVKTDLLGGRISQTISIYQITQSDVEAEDTTTYVGPTGSVASVSLWFQGEVLRSDGLEYELTWSPTDALQLIFNATDDFARYIAEPPGYAYFLGAAPIYSARYQSDLWAKYKVTRGFWVAAGYKYASRFDAISATNYLIYPKTMEYDAAAGYSWEGSHHMAYAVTVNGMNLSNAYLIEAQGTIPMPRRVAAGLTVKY